MSVCTISPHWLRVSLRRVIIPLSGRERDGLTSSTSLSTRRMSPARVGLGAPSTCRLKVAKSGMPGERRFDPAIDRLLRRPDAAGPHVSALPAGPLR
jgi:hypothetical protein